MSEKTAIQKMVGFLEGERKRFPGVYAWLAALDFAQILASEEAKEKPVAMTAAAGGYVNREAVLSVMRHNLNLTADDVDKVYKAVQGMCGYYVPKAEEKPTAPASLVEFAKSEIKIAREQGNGSSFQDGRIYAFEEIISLYRPSPQADIVGHDKPSIPTDKTTGVDQMKFKAE